jgi:hypothetical protein
VWVAVVDTGVRLSHEEPTGQVLNPASQFPGQQLDVVNGDNTVEDNDGTSISGRSSRRPTITGPSPVRRPAAALP